MRNTSRGAGAHFCQIGIVSCTTIVAILVEHFPIHVCWCYGSYFTAHAVFFRLRLLLRTSEVHYNTTQRPGGETVWVGVIWIANFGVKCQRCRWIWTGNFLLRAEVRRRALLVRSIKRHRFKSRKCSVVSRQSTACYDCFECAGLEL